MNEFILRVNEKSGLLDMYMPNDKPIKPRMNELLIHMSAEEAHAIYKYLKHEFERSIRWY